MAKQRPHAKPKAPAEPDSLATRRHEGAGHVRRRVSEPAGPAAVPATVRRAGYFEAVAVYEKGLAALQRHQYEQANALLQSVLDQYPDEADLHDRVRLYLSICARHTTTRPVGPPTVEERLYASTLAINGGNYDEAISQLRLVRDEDPDNDHALYMLAVAHTQRGEHAEAVALLDRSIIINPQNRVLARRDPDLEPLRADAAIQAALGNAPSRDGDTEPRRLPRPKTGR